MIRLRNSITLISCVFQSKRGNSTQVAPPPKFLLHPHPVDASLNATIFNTSSQESIAVYTPPYPHNLLSLLPDLTFLSHGLCSVTLYIGRLSDIVNISKNKLLKGHSFFLFFQFIGKFLIMFDLLKFIMANEMNKKKTFLIFIICFIFQLVLQLLWL